MFLRPFLVTMALFCLSAPVLSAVLSHSSKPLFVPGEVLVRFNDDAQDADKAKVMAMGVSHSTVALDALSMSGVYKMRLSDDADVLKTVESLKGMSGVRYAQPNYKYYALGCTAPTDPYYTTPYNWPLVKIQALQAWTLINWPSCPPGSGVTVAVLDTGIDRGNPDLTMVPNIGYNAICAVGDAASTCTCNGGPSYLDSNSGGAATTDDYGHGTWVSGIIAAEWNNGAGLAGLAGGVTIMPVKVLDCSGSGSSDSISSGINYAINHGAKVLSLSLGGPQDSFEQEAIQGALNAGCVVVAASGNDYANTLEYPAGYPGVIAVGASDENDNVASYSDGGTGVDGKVIDLVAPGGATAPDTTQSFSTAATYTLLSDFVYSAGAANDGGFYPDSSGNYGLAAGTSGATPYVSAAAALVLSLNPTWSNTQVAQQLINNTDSLNGNTGWDIRSGYGRLNVYKALSTSQGSGQVTSYVKTFNSPNPFYADTEPYTHITLVMNQAQSVQLSIYDTSGETVLNRTYDAGQLNNDPSTPQFKSFYIAWDGKNGAGQPVKTGVYFYMVNIGGQISHNKIVVIRGPQ